MIKQVYENVDGSLWVGENYPHSCLHLHACKLKDGGEVGDARTLPVELSPYEVYELIMELSAWLRLQDVTKGIGCAVNVKHQ